VNKIKKKIVLAAAFFIMFVSCSSAPKNSGDVYHYRTQAEMLLDSGNRESSKGNFNNSLVILSESKRLSILSDDPSLLIRSSLARGNVLLSLGRINEAFLEWEQAAAVAEKLGNRELVSACRIFHSRGSLLTGRLSAQSVLNTVNSEQENIRQNRLYIAFSWQTKGLALRALNSPAEAEDAILRSLEIHQKDMYLENASFDWYTIASIRSLSGNTTGALRALEASIEIDRRIENSYGLAASWRAMGDVYRKSGREQEALEAYGRAKSIYSALGYEREVREIDARMGLKE